MAVLPKYRMENVNYVAGAPPITYNSALYSIYLAESGRPAVGYSKVAEKIYANFQAERVGQTIHYFKQNEVELNTNTTTSTSYEYIDANGRPVTEYIAQNTDSYLAFRPQHDFENGTPLKTEIYNEANQKTSETLMEYTPNNGKESLKIYAKKASRYTPEQQTKPYYYSVAKYRLEKSTQKKYSDDGSGSPLTQTTEYVYKDEMPQTYQDQYKGQHNMVVKTITQDAQGRNIESHQKYVADFLFDTDTIVVCDPTCVSFCADPPCDYAAPGCAPNCLVYQITEHVPAQAEAKAIYDMLQNKIGMPIETISKRNNKIISASYISYANTLRLPYQIFGIRDVPKAFMQEVNYDKTIATFYKEPSYGLPSATILEYNSQGQATQTQQTFGAKSNTVYDSIGLLPIQATQNHGKTNAQTATTSYPIPLEGPAEETGPNGLKKKYIYDKIDGKLLEIRDKDNNILQKNQYNTKPQN